MKSRVISTIRKAAQVLKNKTGSEAGFSLIELMVAGAILGVLMVAFSGFMFQQLKQNKDQQNKQNVNQLTSSVLDTTSQSESISKSEDLQFDNIATW